MIRRSGNPSRGCGVNQIAGVAWLDTTWPPEAVDRKTVETKSEGGGVGTRTQNVRHAQTHIRMTGGELGPTHVA